MSRDGDGTWGDAVERRARDGDWIGVFGSRTSVLLPPDARERAARLWPLVDVGADHVAVLDALLSAGGLTALPDFVLVETVDDRTRVVVRGAGEVVAHSPEGRVRVRAGDRLWEEDSFVGLVALEVALPGTRRSDVVTDVPVRPGIVRVGGVAWGHVPQAVPTPPGVPLVAVPPPPGPDTGPDSDPDTGAVPGEEDPQEPEGPEVVHVAPPAPPAPPAPRAVPPEPETAPLSAIPLTPPWQEDVTSRLPAEEVGGLAALGFGGSDPEPPPPPPEPPTPEWHSGGHVVAQLAFSHGVTVAVDGPVLVGRSPSPRPGSPGARLVTVPSPHQEVSSTHLEIRPGDGLDLGNAVVTDLGSTNGTLVVVPGQQGRELHPGEPLALRPGAVVDLGDGVTVEVRRP